MAANLQTVKARVDDVAIVDMDEMELVTWSSARCQFLAIEALNGYTWCSYHIPRLAAFWLISLREQRQTTGDEHLRNVDAKGGQTVSIRRLLRLDLTIDNAAPLSGYECIGRA